MASGGPDGGWGWFVVLGAYCSRILTFGLYNSYGPIIIEWIEYFDCSTAYAVWVFSLAGLVQSVTSLIVANLMTRVGMRPVVMVGAAFVSVGFLLSTFAETIEHLFITIGIVCGIGIGMINTPSILIVGVYFKDHLTLANGLVFLGSSTGQLFFPPLFVKLTNIYGWRGTLLIFAAITSNLFACGALFRPLNRPNNPPRTEVSINDDHNTEEKAASTRQPTEMMNSTCNQRTCCPYILPCYGRSTCCAKHQKVRSSERSGRVPFIMLLACTFFVGTGIMMPLAHLANKVTLEGLSKEKAAMLITHAAIGTIIGRGGHGWFIDRKIISGQTLMLLSILFTVFEAFSFVLTSIYPVLIILSFLHGFHSGIVLCLSVVVPRYLVKPSEVSVAIGLCNMLHGIGNALGPLVGGLVFDKTNNYFATFSTAAILYVISALCLLPTCCFLKKQRQQSEIIK